MSWAPTHRVRNTFITVFPYVLDYGDIVIGSRERHGVSILFNFTEDTVLHAAPCDVLAVRFPKDGRATAASHGSGRLGSGTDDSRLARNAAATSPLSLCMECDNDEASRSARQHGSGCRTDGLASNARPMMVRCADAPEGRAVELCAMKHPRLRQRSSPRCMAPGDELSGRPPSHTP